MSGEGPSGSAGPLPPGLSLQPGYLRREEELELARRVDLQPWNQAWARRRQLYGKRYDQTPTAPFPPFLVTLSDRLLREQVLPARAIGAVVNEYLPGQGIALHHDRFHFGDVVVSLSLLSDIELELARGSERLTVDLPRRSLLRLSGDARWIWMHGIRARGSDRIGGLLRPRGRRISITLRIARAAHDPTPSRQPRGAE